ncbi:MAG: hypothetical protein GC160_26705 [Acidobacteria bacterium]|nr:hypothetical protein [Acidobacteriota bacterium]
MLERRALTLLVLLTALFYWRYTLSDRFTFLETPDGANQVLPWLDMQARAWQSDRAFPLWDPYQWGGQPLLGLMQPGAALPPNWPLFLAPLGEDGHIQLRYIHWQQTLLRLLGGLFAFALARQLRVSRAGALLAGLGFVCLGASASSGWPQITNGIIWAPAVGLFLARLLAAETVSDRLWQAALCGAMLGFAVLGGHPRAPLFQAFAVAGVLLAAAIMRRRASLLGALAVVAASALAVGALQVLPAWEFGRDAVRWVNLERPLRFDEPLPYFVDEALRLNPVHLFAVVIPIVPGPGDPYLGWTVLVLAGFGLLHGRRTPGVAALTAVGLAALLYSFGPQTPLHGWIYGLVPLAEKARGAAHALFLWELAALLLAARGLDRLEEALADRWPVRLLTGFAAVAAAAVLLELVLGRRGDPAQVVYHGEFVAFSALAALLLAGVLAAGRRQALPRNAMRPLLLGLLLLEAGAAHWLVVAEQDDPVRAVYLERLQQPAGALAFLKTQPGPFRFELVPGGGGINLGDWHGLESIEGYLTAVSGNVYDLMDQTGWTEGRLLLNTVYTVAREPTRDEQIEVFADADGWKVFRNPDAHPRAWFEADGSCSSDQAAVEIAEKGFQTMTVEVDSACPGLLVLAEVWAPGWRAAVNGADRPVEQVHRALRGVALEAGRSRVELSYRPTTVVAGGTLTGTSLAVLLGGAAWRWRRRRRTKAGAAAV